ncbi:MAG: DUF4364 family protein [Lachnospiraceae bacterium]|nr:DUF4364 family protein [Lachnospiraceae bacterium]
MAEPDTIYRVMVLYMLDAVDFPLTNTQISDFLLEKDYTDYFSIQKILNGLVNAGLIECTTTHNNTQYFLTNEGKLTLPYFEDKLNDSIIADIKQYLKDNKLKLKEENRAFAAYIPTVNDSYDVRCQIQESSHPVIDITINVKTKEQAKAICSNWTKENSNVYTYLMDVLLQ